MKYRHILAYAALGLTTIGCQPQQTKESKKVSATQTEGSTGGSTDQTEVIPSDPSLPTYRIATINTYPPFATAGTDGSLAGFDIDIMRAIGKVEKFNAEFINTPWDAWETDLSTGVIDIWAAGITIKEKRKKVATYSNSYMAYETTILTLNTPKYENLNESTLANYILGAEANSTSFEIASTLQPNEEKTMSFISNSSAFEALLQNKINAIVGNNLVLSNITTDYPDYKYKLIPISKAITAKKELGFMVKKDRTELSDKINVGLHKIQEDGTYNKIKTKWFGDL